jgi:hypothetical protein
MGLKCDFHYHEVRHFHCALRAIEIHCGKQCSRSDSSCGTELSGFESNRTCALDLVAGECTGRTDLGGIRIDVTGGNGSNFQVLPGPGLAKLKAVYTMTVVNIQRTWSNTNLAFLSSLRCSGSTSGPTKLTSLAGLDNIVDGVAEIRTSYVAFDFVQNANLTNVMALNAYARCGTATQRPDGWGLPMPFVQVQACRNVLSTWATLCNYVRFGVCPGAPLPPQPPPAPPPPPMPQCPSTVLPTPLDPGGSLVHSPYGTLRQVFYPSFYQSRNCH